MGHHPSTVSMPILQHSALSPLQAVAPFPRSNVKDVFKKSSNLKVRLQLFENTCSSRSQKNTPGNCQQKMSFQSNSHLYYSPPLCSQQREFHPLLPSPSYPHPSTQSSSSSSSLTAQNTGQRRADWLWGVSSSSTPLLAQDQILLLPQCAMFNKAPVCFSLKTQVSLHRTSYFLIASHVGWKKGRVRSGFSLFLEMPM